MYYPKNTSRLIIPAQPEWFVAWPWRDPENKIQAQGLTLDPIIAWLVTHDVSDYREARSTEKVVSADPWPITVDGLQENIGSDSAIKSPDGQLHLPSDRSFENEQKFLAYWWEKQDEIEAAKTKNTEKVSR